MHDYTNDPWYPIYLKLDESSFFLDQLKANQKTTRLVFFYLSAFLSASRSVTFHIQKQFVPRAENGRQIYQETVKELLSGDICDLFLGLRNLSSHQMYPPLRLCIYEYLDDQRVQPPVCRAMLMLTKLTSSEVNSAEELMTFNWGRKSLTYPYWVILHESNKWLPLFESCESYYSQLRAFVKLVKERMEGRSH